MIKQKQTPEAAPKLKLTPDEQAIISYLEKAYGRPLTPQEIHVSLEQARAVGNL